MLRKIKHVHYNASEQERNISVFCVRMHQTVVTLFVMVTEIKVVNILKRRRISKSKSSGL